MACYSGQQCRAGQVYATMKHWGFGAATKQAGQWHCRGHTQSCQCPLVFPQWATPATYSVYWMQSGGPQRCHQLLIMERVIYFMTTSVCRIQPSCRCWALAGRTSAEHIQLPNAAMQKRASCISIMNEELQLRRSATVESTSSEVSERCASAEMDDMTMQDEKMLETTAMHSTVS